MDWMILIYVESVNNRGLIFYYVSVDSTIRWIKFSYKSR